MFTRDYLTFSVTQGSQLLNLITFMMENYDTGFVPRRVLDVGCGGGNASLLLAQIFRNAEVVGIDKSEELIAEARVRGKNVKNLRFVHRDFLEYEDEEGFDLIFSNAVFHWFGDRAVEAYRKTFSLLRFGGYLASHQGGRWSYFPLRYMMERILREEGYEVPRYPLFYPTTDELRRVLEEEIGFSFVRLKRRVEAELTDRDVYVDFLHAGAIPYLEVVPDAEKDRIRSKFVEVCRKEEVPSLPVRLYVVARKTEGLSVVRADGKDLGNLVLQVEELLEEADREFVPPLSQRVSTTQKDFTVGECADCISLYLQSLLKQKFLLALDRDRLVGFLSYTEGFPFAGRRFASYVSTIIVRKGYRGLGVGKELYRFLMNEKGEVLVRTWTGNLAHIKLLSDLNFSLFRREKDHRGEGIDTLYFLYRK